MRQKRDVVPYMHSADMTVNVSLTLAKIRNRIRKVLRGEAVPEAEVVGQMDFGPSVGSSGLASFPGGGRPHPGDPLP